jgi:hypothetical protein
MAKVRWLKGSLPWWSSPKRRVEVAVGLQTWMLIRLQAQAILAEIFSAGHLKCWHFSEQGRIQKGWSSIYHIDRNDMKYYETIAYSWFCTETPVNLINLLRNWLKIQWSFSQFVPRHVWLITQNNQERTYQTSVDSFANLCSFGSCSKTTGEGSSEHVSATFR